MLYYNQFQGAFPLRFNAGACILIAISRGIRCFKKKLKNWWPYLAALSMRITSGDWIGDVGNIKKIIQYCCMKKLLKEDSKAIPSLTGKISSLTSNVLCFVLTSYLSAESGWLKTNKQQISSSSWDSHFSATKKNLDFFGPLLYAAKQT